MKNKLYYELLRKMSNFAMKSKGKFWKNIDKKWNLDYTIFKLYNLNMDKQFFMQFHITKEL